MAYYNGGFPATYQPMVPQYQAPYAAQTQQNAQSAANPQQGIIWVQGEQAAKSYLVAPNTTVQLWDSEEKVIYLKSADASGMPSMKVLDYTIRGDANTAQAPAAEFATKDDLRALEDKIRDIREEMAGRRRANRLTKEDDDE